jgi:hypothetical protein
MDGEWKIGTDRDADGRSNLSTMYGITTWETSHLTLQSTASIGMMPREHEGIDDRKIVLVEVSEGHLSMLPFMTGMPNTWTIDAVKRTTTNHTNPTTGYEWGRFHETFKARYIIIAVDYFTRYLSAKAAPVATTAVTRTLSEKGECVHVVQPIYTDNGSHSMGGVCQKIKDQWERNTSQQYGIRCQLDTARLT